jgi:mannose-6-phosphate isomerase-like protein (cupin superfamily)
VRRVVTGPGDGGAAVILASGEPTTVIEAGQYRTTELWVTDRTPPTVVRAGDPAGRPWELEPPPRGSCFRIVQIAPETAAPATPAAPADPAESAQDADTDFLAEHTTSTLDYVVVLSGQVTLTVGGAEVTLGPGDAVVQQGVAHDWKNRGTEPAVLAGVLISTR